MCRTIDPPFKEISSNMAIEFLKKKLRKMYIMGSGGILINIWTSFALRIWPQT